MGKPIAGRDKFPYGADGIVVAGAKLQDGTVLTNVRISKQRSVLVFDLLNAGTVLQKLKITTLNASGAELNVASSDATLAASLAPGTFFVRAVNTAGDQLGLVIRFQLNKVVVSDGSSVFDMDYSKGTDGVVAVTGVTLAPTTASLAVAGTQQLTPTVAPSTATNKAVSYVSSAPSVATVSTTGLITAVATGTATITVTTTDGSKTATCVVTVA